MSLSTLEAQLAALNNSTRIGVIGSNKRHDELAGRGLGFQAQIGHSITHTDTSFKYKPSLIHESARAAADIPLKTIQATAVDALDTILRPKYPSTLMESVYQLVTETKVPNKKKALDKLLHRTLVLFSSLLSEEPDASLQVLEYLLRKYNLHTEYAHELLWVFFPYMDVMPKVFSKCIQLIDFSGSSGTNTHQSYVWLRPYTLVDSSSNNKDNVVLIPPRSKLAHQTMQSIHILRTMCHITTTVATIVHEQEQQQQQQTNQSTEARRGIAHILSFTAALMVEGLHWMRTSNKKTIQMDETHQESVLRTLIPTIITACTSSTTTVCTDYKWWGYMIASTLSETMDLAPTVVTLLTSKIWMGCQQQQEDADAAADGLATILSILLQPANFQNHQRPPSNFVGLPLVSEQLLGCPLPENFLATSCWNKNNNKSTVSYPLATLLGILHEDRQMTILPFVAAVLVQAMQEMQKQQKQQQEEEESSDRCLQFIQSLLREPKLQSLYVSSATSKRIDLVASLASFLVEQYATTATTNNKKDDDNDDTSMDETETTTTTTPLLLNQYRVILTDLHGLDTVACERGVAMTIQKNRHANNNTTTTAAQLDKLLQGIVIPETTTTTTTNNDGENDNAMDTDDDDLWKLLPLRVAMNHANAMIRKQAIEKLAIHHETIMDASLLGSLVRRFGTDTDITVSFAACQAVVTGLQHQQDNDNDNDNALVQEENVSNLASYALAGCYRSIREATVKSNEEKDGGDDAQELLNSSLQLVALIAKGIAKLGNEDFMNFWQRCMEVLVAHISSSSSSSKSAFSKTAAKCIFLAFEEEEEKDVQRYILRKTIFLKRLVDNFSKFAGQDDTEASLRLRCVWTVLGAAIKDDKKKSKKKSSDNSSSSSSSGDTTTNVMEYVLPLTLKVITDIPAELSKKHCDMVKSCIEKANVKNEEIPDLIVNLSMAKNEATFVNVCDPAIRAVVGKVRDRNDKIVSPYAVLLEAVLRPLTTKTSKLRLLSIVKDLASFPESAKTSWVAIVPGLKLLEDPDEAVRKAALKVLRVVEKSISANKKSTLGRLKGICEQVSSVKSSVLIGGSSLLPSILATTIEKSSDATDLRKTLLTLCVAAAFSCGTEMLPSSLGDVTGGLWMSPRSSIGGSISATSILTAAELAGEKSFPLLLRWRHAGKLLLEQTLNNEHYSYKGVSGALPSILMNCVVKMMKGVVVSESETAVPPSSGKRVRSSSVGKMDEITFLSPYPLDMAEALCEIFASCVGESEKPVMTVAPIVAREVLSSQAWGDSVFRQLPKPSRTRLATLIFQYLGTDPLDIPESLNSNLPFDCDEVVDLLSVSEVDATQESLLIEFVRSNAERLSLQSNASVLISLLFDQLKALISNPVEDQALLEYLQQMLLATLLQMLESFFTRNETNDIDKKTVDEWTNILMTVIDGTGDQKANKFSPRAKSVALKVLTTLCSQFPKDVVTKLIPAALSSIHSNGITEGARVTFGVLSSVLPVFLKYASKAGLSFLDFVQPFAELADKVESESDKQNIYKALNQALVTSLAKSDLSTDEGHFKLACVVSVHVFYLVFETPKNSEEASLNRKNSFAVELMKAVPTSAQVLSLVMVLQYVNGLLQLITNASVEPEVHELFEAFKDMVPSASDLARIATNGPSSKAKSGKVIYNRDKMYSVAEVILHFFSDCLTLDGVRRFVRKDEGITSLQLWQDLLAVQSAAKLASKDGLDENRKCSESIESMLNENHEYLQSILPARMFLASVSGMIKGGGTTENKIRALQLVAEKVSVIENPFREIPLFVDLIPDILALQEAAESRKTYSEMETVLSNTAFVAIDTIARVFHVNKSGVSASYRKTSLKHFVATLKCCSGLLVKSTPKLSSFENVTSMNDLLTSAALCAANIVRVVGAQSLPMLPTLMKPLMSMLENANQAIEEGKERSVENEALIKTMQLSIIRAFTNIVEAVPQFVPPYLPNLLTAALLLSGTLRIDQTIDEFQLHIAIRRLDTAFAAHISARLLIPQAIKALAKCTRLVDAQAMLFILKGSIENASAADVATHRNPILQTIMKSIELNIPWEELSTLIECCVDVIDDLVMKVSEIQLRRLYSSLKDWKGEIDKSNPNEGAIKRYAFWLLSARLSKKLRSIYLPCLSTVFDDLMSELDLAVTQLCTHEAVERVASGKKKRRLEAKDISSSYGVDCMRTLHPLLICLEESLRADAHEGGIWVRAEENQRYETLLKPLGKLLLSRIPSEFPLSEKVTNGYQYIIEGTGLDEGSVVGCLVALASAGADEQLWKPLHHVVLTASGEEGRSECRRAGLVCLLALMKSLGEEYMVLLPETLPVLSELLEDSNEEVASLSKEVITLAEELIGESLEDALN